MKSLKYLFIGALFVANSTVSYGADLPAAPYKAPLVPIGYNWNGFYVGVNAGYGIALNPADTTLATPDFLAFQHIDFHPNGFIGGGQIGYNWQTLPNWLLGIEADFQYSAQKFSANCDVCFGIPGRGSFTQEIDWFGTIRARGGYTYGPALFYLTGGYAYARLQTQPTYFLQSTVVTSNFDQTKSGWTIGGGVEAQLGGNWTAKVEYLYMDFGSVDYSFNDGKNNGIKFSGKFTDNIVRAGLNYRFDWGNPVVSRWGLGRL